MKRQNDLSPRPVPSPRDWRRVARLPGFHRLVGFSFDPVESRRGVCVVRGEVLAKHLNINRVVHGGVYATVLDTAMGASVVTTLDKNETTATTSLYIEFLRPAREGDHLRAVGKLVRRGRHLAFVEGELRDGARRLLGQAHGTWYIWGPLDRRPRSPVASSPKLSERAKAVKSQ